MLNEIFFRRSPYEDEIKKLEAAIATGNLDENERMEDCREKIEQIIRWNSIWDGGDWVELDIEARERKLVVVTVKDFLNLLREINYGARN